MMKRSIIFQSILILCLFWGLKAGATTVSKAPYIRTAEFVYPGVLLADTIPAGVKPAEAATAKPATDKPVTTVIKAVPRARKVAVPKPVTIKVTPVKVIKPKIIKPVLKVL
jgi:hypothetical protein